MSGYRESAKGERCKSGGSEVEKEETVAKFTW